MSKERKSDAETQTASTKKSSSRDGGASELQETFDRAQEQGFFGTEVDPTPNENYTLQGVTGGKPTPETDAKLAGEVREQTKMGKSALELNAEKEGNK